MSPSLSIVIPTYNRRERLLGQLHSIYQQPESSEVEIVVCDNHSDYNVYDAIVKEFGKEKIANLTVHVNERNVGMHANLALIFQHCHTDWMWSLGDDDETLPGSIAVILRDIKSHPEALLFKYAIAGFKQYDNCEVNTCEAFIDFYYNGNSDPGHLIFLSNNVYRMAPVRENYGMTLSYCYCAVAQLLPVFFSLKKGQGPILLRNDEVVAYKVPAPGTGWHFMQTAIDISSMTLLPLNLPSSHLYRLGLVLMGSFSHSKMVRLCLAHPDRRYGRFQYLQIYKCSFRYSKKFKHKLYRWVFGFCYFTHLNLNGKIYKSLLDLIGKVSPDLADI